MRRRRFLVASLSAFTGCTATGYRASGPRTPPPAPATEISSTAPVDPVETRAQAVIRPLNDLYRTVRGPLGSFDVEDVAPETLDEGEGTLTRVRDALASFEQGVSNPPDRYQSLSLLVTAHERLFDALAAAVECWSVLSSVDGDGVPADGALDTARSARATLTDVTTALRAVADENPTIPASVFLTVERVRAFTAMLETQSRIIGRLIDASERALAGSEDWRIAVGAFERDTFDEARNAFDAARVHYRAATDVLDAIPVADGSFAGLVPAYSCLATAGVEATAGGFDAVDAALAGDVARADRLLERAETTRIRCPN